MATNPIRVPDTVHGEVHAAARLLGCSAAELPHRAWRSFRASPELAAEFDAARKAFSAGDLEAVASRLHERATERAKRRAETVKALRRER